MLYISYKETLRAPSWCECQDKIRLVHVPGMGFNIIT
jgi:hypothetical protein